MLQCQKELFYLPAGMHYLNCGYMSPLARRVEEAGIAGMRRKRVPSEIEPADFFEEVELVRERFARIIGAPDASRIALIPSASYGLATAARNLQLQPGQNVVLSSAQFPANVYVWRRTAAERGLEVRTIEPPTEMTARCKVWNERVIDAIDGDTGLVALGHVHWTDGSLFDLQSIGERTREVGAALVVDGTQSVGAMPFLVGEIEPDALVCAGYKWLLGPYSIGVAYYGPRFDGGYPLEDTWIAREGSRDFRQLVNYQDAYRPGAVRYDVGETSNFVLVPMLRAALELLLEWGVTAVAAYCGALTERLVRAAGELGFGAEEAGWRAAHMVGLRMPDGVDPGVVSAELAQRRVSVSVRGDVLRVSPNVYNDESDVAALCEVLADLAGHAAA